MFLCLTIHTATALRLLSSARTLDVTSTVVTRMHVRSSMRAHSPLSCFERERKLRAGRRADTRQTWWRMSLFSLFLVAVLAEHVGCLSSGDRDRGLRIWNEREARRNEWNSVLVVTPNSQIFDVVMLAGGDHGFAWKVEPVHSGTSAKSLQEILSPPRAKLLELMCAIERMEDLVRRYCGRRDAQGNAHTLAEDVMNSLPCVKHAPRKLLAITM